MLTMFRWMAREVGTPAVIHGMRDGTDLRTTLRGSVRTVGWGVLLGRLGFAEGVDIMWIMIFIIVLLLKIVVLQGWCIFDSSFRILNDIY